MSRVTVALVEDNADNRFLLGIILSARFDVIEYESGRDAVAGLRDNRPDVVLLDISLPDIDGTEVLTQIRTDQRLRTLPVIALTANALAGDRERYLGAGFDAYLTKPVLDETILFDAIEGVLKPNE